MNTIMALATHHNALCQLSFAVALFKVVAPMHFTRNQMMKGQPMDSPATTTAPIVYALGQLSALLFNPALPVIRIA